MFSLDLKNLLQLSYCNEGISVSHKRIQCGKISYNICFELRNGHLSVRQVKRVKIEERKSTRVRRLRRQRPRQLMQPSHTSFVSKSSSHTDGASDKWQAVQADNVGSQTERPEQRQVAVDTMDLIFMISRHQQSMQVCLNTASSQTKRISLEPRSTQMEHSSKTKMTQTCEEKSRSSCVVSTQTVAALQVQHSCAQTTLAQDEQELLQPHTQLMSTLLHSSGLQAQLLNDASEAISYLVSLKELELQKEQLRHAHKLKQMTIKKARKHCKHRCKHCLRRQIRRKPKLELAVNQTQTEALATPTPTDCNTQQRKFESQSTQTDKHKGFRLLLCN